MRRGSSTPTPTTSRRSRVLARGTSRSSWEPPGLHEIEEDTLSVSLEHRSFDDWWEPYTLGVGPVGVYVAGLDPDRAAQLRERCRELLPSAPFVLTALAWAARGLVPPASR